MGDGLSMAVKSIHTSASSFYPLNTLTYSTALTVPSLDDLTSVD
eukprot:SAG31_NODE_1091_length_9958_cov_10.108429_6_plen_44_part_00